jgi:tRNA nucleotidyltransferase/poly(A) polymerase
MIFSDYRLKNKILADQYNSITFEKGRGRETYLVGGYIRDILRGIHSSDRDYIVSGDIKSFVNEIRKIVGGTIVKFKKGDMIRIAFKDGLTFDFSKLIGTLKEDLTKRDFTINAIAWSPEKGIIDHYNGLKDIEQKKIRSISKENLISDPLRMLRAYRFAAELNGSIERNTRKAIKMLHNNIKGVSPERITLELFNLLNSKHSARYLKMALSDGLLTDILSIPYRNLERNIKEISKVEQTTINKIPSKIQALLKRIFSQNLTYKGLFCLELLMQIIPLHPPLIPPLVRGELKGGERGRGDYQEKIKISSAINKRLELSHKGIKELKRKGVDLKNRLFDIFLISKDAVIDILIIKGRLDLIKDYQRFKRIWRKGLLSSEDIINITDVKPGLKLGKIIIQLKRAQFEGRVRSKRAAIKFVEKLRE